MDEEVPELQHVDDFHSREAILIESITDQLESNLDLSADERSRLIIVIFKKYIYDMFRTGHDLADTYRNLKEELLKDHEIL